MFLKHKEEVAFPCEALHKTYLLKHQIKLKVWTQPVYLPSYKLPHSKLATVDQLITEMLSQDVTEPSEWSFPLIIVPKSDGSMRSVMN